MLNTTNTILVISRLDIFLSDYINAKPELNKDYESNFLLNPVASGQVSSNFYKKRVTNEPLFLFLISDIF